MLETMNFAHCSCAKLLTETSIHRNSRTLWKRGLAANPGNSSGTNYKAIDREHLENVIERTSLSSAMGQWRTCSKPSIFPSKTRRGVALRDAFVPGKRIRDNRGACLRPQMVSIPSSEPRCTQLLTRNYPRPRWSINFRESRAISWERAPLARHVQIICPPRWLATEHDVNKPVQNSIAVRSRDETNKVREREREGEGEGGKRKERKVETRGCVATRWRRREPI